MSERAPAPGGSRPQWLAVMDAIRCALLLAAFCCAVALSEVEILKPRSDVNYITSKKVEPIIIAITNFKPDETATEDSSAYNQNVSEDPNVIIIDEYQIKERVIQQDFSESIKTFLSPITNDEEADPNRVSENITDANFDINNVSVNSTVEPVVPQETLIDEADRNASAVTHNDIESTSNGYSLKDHEPTKAEDDKPTKADEEEQKSREQKAFQVLGSYTNFIPQTEREKYSQLIASYKFMQTAKVNKWTDLEATRETTSADPNAVPLPETPINTDVFGSEKNLLKYMAQDTYFGYKERLENIKTTMTTYTVPPTPTTSAKSIFVQEPLECPKEKLETKTTTTKFKPIAKMREFPSDEDGVWQEDHKFYKSRIITNSTYFEEHWANITNSPNKLVTHPVASQHAYMKKLQFQFPYFGHKITNVTISTGGYLMTGMAGLSWSADAQGLEPFMTDFDTTDAEDSSIILFDDLDKLTVVWEDMPLRRYGANFTFAATLYDNGDITFAYKNIPMTAQELDEKQLSVSIGLADSFLMNKIAFFVRRKASRSYARIAFDKNSVVSDTVLELQAQPSCPGYTNCGDCVRHGEIYSNFKCLWCEKLQKCTSGNDYNRPLLSACRFLDECSASKGQIAASMSPGLNMFNNNIFSMKK